MMTHKAATLFGLNARLVDVIFLMTFGAVIHFHAIPRVAFDAGNIFTPDVDAVSADAVFAVNS